MIIFIQQNVFEYVLGNVGYFVQASVVFNDLKADCLCPIPWQEEYME